MDRPRRIGLRPRDPPLLSGSGKTLHAKVIEPDDRKFLIAGQIGLLKTIKDWNLRRLRAI
jgi:hypothetical protein